MPASQECHQLLWPLCRLPGPGKGVPREAGTKPRGSFLVPSSSPELKRCSWYNCGANPDGDNLRLGKCMALDGFKYPSSDASHQRSLLIRPCIHPDSSHLTPVHLSHLSLQSVLGPHPSGYTSQTSMIHSWADFSCPFSPGEEQIK